jgi:hypothetical protein
MCSRRSQFIVQVRDEPNREDGKMTSDLSYLLASARAAELRQRARDASDGSRTRRRARRRQDRAGASRTWRWRLRAA